MKGRRAPANLLAWSVLVALLRSAPAFATPEPVQAVAIDPVTPTTIYATMDPATVFKSTDGGANWIRTTLPPPANPVPWKPGHVPALVIDPLTPTTLYVATDYGVSKSTDGGATWAAAGGVANRISHLAIDPLTPTTVYAVRSLAEGGSDPRLFKTTDGGVTWHEADSFFIFMSLAVDPVTPTTIYSSPPRQYFAGTTAVLKSIDGGATWTEVGVPRPWPYGTISALAIDPVTPTTLYAGASLDYLCPECESDLYPELFGLLVPGGAFKSTDGGVSWQPIGLQNVQTFSALAVDPMTTTTVYAGTNAGLFKTTDGGATWQATGLSTADVRAVAIDPLTPTTLYAGTDSGVFKSIDGGATWSATGAMEPTVTAVSSVSLAPTTIAGGGSSTGTVALNAPAPPGGTVVTLSSSNPPTASVPGAVTVPSGNTTATFAVATSPVQSSTTVAISATAGGATRSAALTVMSPDPTLTALVPSTISAGHPGGILTVNGTNFVSGSVVRWNGANRTTTFVNATQLQATIPGSDLATPGTRPVTVVNPDGRTTNALTFTITGVAPPTLASLAPSTASAGGPAFTLTVNGTNFVSGAVVRWNGANRTTTFVSATKLTASIPATSITIAGSPPVTVVNPDGRTSNALTFTVTAMSPPGGKPTLTSLAPNTIFAGHPGGILTVNGTDFVSGSVVRWNGANRTTTFVNATQLQATIPGSDLVTPGTRPVTVANPDGRISNALTFTITP